MPPNDKLRVNEKIRIREIRLIGAEGEQLGVMTPADGMKLAKEAGLDLVEVAPTVFPPVCRIMDYSKYKYDQAKKLKEAKKKQKVIHIKEIKFHPRVSEHDYNFKKRHIENFIRRGDKVKITMNYRGREMAHLETGQEVLKRLSEELAPIAQIEKAPLKEGRSITMVIMPK